MTRRILVSAPYFLPVVDRFRPRFAAAGFDLVVAPVIERLAESDLLPLVGDIDGTICGDDEYTDRVLAQAPRLRVISKWGTGIDSIDLQACARRGVTVCNTPNAFTIPVADNTLGYVLMFVRQLHTQADAMRAGHWGKSALRSVGETTVGIVGLGNIGREVARRLVPFGARLIGTDPVAPPVEFVEATGIGVVDYPAVLRDSDIVTLHCNLNPSSFHIMNAHAIEQMRPGAFVINTARGRLVDQSALTAALISGRLSGAALDVFEHEPLPVDDPLRRMPNVLLASHNSNSSSRAWEHVHERTVANLLASLDGNA